MKNTSNRRNTMNKNTTTEQTAERPMTEEEHKAAEIQTKFDEQEECFRATEKHIAVLRAFIANHREAFAVFSWTAYGWNDTEIKFYTPGYPTHNAKTIAKAFGTDGWKRGHNKSSCGSINWTKETGGVTLIIQNAEQLSRELVKEVRL